MDSSNLPAQKPAAPAEPAPAEPAPAEPAQKPAAPAEPAPCADGAECVMWKRLNGGYTSIREKVHCARLSHPPLPPKIKPVYSDDDSDIYTDGAVPLNLPEYNEDVTIPFYNEDVIIPFDNEDDYNQIYNDEDFD